MKQLFAYIHHVRVCMTTNIVVPAFSRQTEAVKRGKKRSIPTFAFLPMAENQY